MRRFPVILLILGVVSTTSAWAQTGQVVGTVTDQATGAPLPGATVSVDGRSSVTGDNGRYLLAGVPAGTREVRVTLLGYATASRQASVTAGQITTADFQLNVEAIQLGEALVVTGYRVQDRRTVTGSVSSVSSSEFENIPVDNLSSALAGRLSGTTIMRQSGSPGRESDIQIRAQGTFNNSNPLFVIDGIVTDKFTFDGLSSQEVESISILKDGAAAAVYGSRAANGVILVTTKRGRPGVAPQFSYSGTVGVQTPTRIPNSLNAFEHATAINNGLIYNNVPTTDARYYTPDELEYFRTHSWNWVDELWKDPVTMNHSLNVTGGTDGVRYYLSGSFNRAAGSFDNLNFQRLTSRANIDVDLTQNLTASVDFSTARRDADGPRWGGGDGGENSNSAVAWDHEDLYKALLLRTSMVPPYINGIPVGNWVEWHPGSVIGLEGGYNRRDWSDFNARVRFAYRVPFVEGLDASMTYAKSNRETHRRQFSLPYEMMFFNTTGENNHIVGDQPVGPRPRNAADYLYSRQDRDDNYQLNGQLNFRRGFGGHNVDALLVYEQSESDHVWFEGRRDDFISPAIDQYIGGSSDREDSEAYGEQNQSARISYVGSVSYDYARKYLLTGSFRYDGSVIFAPENRWGFFPSISAGWRIAEEPFFNVGLIDDLMLRASYGVVGNDDVGQFQWLQSYDIEGGAIFGDPTVGLEPGQLANRDLTWEKSASYNLGLDAGLWDRRLSLSFDVFRRITTDILGEREDVLPTTFGADLPDENWQEVDSRGFELELGYDGQFGDPGSPINYYLRGDFGYAINEVVELDEPVDLPTYRSRKGRPIMPGGSTAGGCFGYLATGILRTQTELDALPDDYRIDGRVPQLGDMNYRDLRGPDADAPDGRITSADRAWICDYVDPPVNYGFSLGASWKALRLDALLHGAAGHQHRMHTNGRDLQARAEESAYGYWRDAWTAENPDGAYPGWRRDGHYRTRYPVSDFWVRDASFLRLKDVTLSFGVPQGIASLFRVDQARVFLTGTNLLLLYDEIGDWGFDPEANNIRAYPPMRTFTLGLNVSQ